MHACTHACTHARTHTHTHTHTHTLRHTNKSQLLTCHERCSCFCNITYSGLTETFQINRHIVTSQGRRSADEQRDEAFNRRSSLLHTLSTVARVSSVCEKKAVFAICQMVRKHHFDTELVMKVILRHSGPSIQDQYRFYTSVALLSGCPAIIIFLVLFAPS